MVEIFFQKFSDVFKIFLDGCKNIFSKSWDFFLGYNYDVKIYNLSIYDGFRTIPELHDMISAVFCLLPV